MHPQGAVAIVTSLENTASDIHARSFVTVNFMYIHGSMILNNSQC